MKERRRPTHKQILAELIRKPRIPTEIREDHGDIEEVITKAGGKRGSLNRAAE